MKLINKAKRLITIRGRMETVLHPVSKKPVKHRAPEYNLLPAGGEVTVPDELYGPYVKALIEAGDVELVGKEPKGSNDKQKDDLGLDDMNEDQLLDFAASLGIEGLSKRNKVDTIKEKIREAMAES